LPGICPNSSVPSAAKQQHGNFTRRYASIPQPSCCPRSEWQYDHLDKIRCLHYDYNLGLSALDSDYSTLLDFVRVSKADVSIQGIFGMEFFQMNQETKNVDVSPEIWQFFVAATGTTVLTMLVYYLMAGFPHIRREARSSSQTPDTTAHQKPVSTVKQPRRCSTDIEKSWPV
jgi:hypothetical protein